MVPSVITWGILFFEIIQVMVAFIAVVLALSWEKLEFLAGLLFLLMYSILDMADIFLFSIAQGIYLDVAQFGFILLATIFFIYGMSPSWKSPKAAGTHENEPGDTPSDGVWDLFTSKKNLKETDLSDRVLNRAQN